MSHESRLREHIFLIQVASIIWALGWRVGGTLVLIALIIPLFTSNGLGLIALLWEQRKSDGVAHR